MPHVHDTTVFVLAEHEPCTAAARGQRAANAMRTTKSGKVGRDIRVIGPRDLLDASLPVSWILIALLCPGDDLAKLTTWTKADPSRASRIRFYHHRTVEPGPLLRPWTQAGLPFPSVDEFSGQRDLSARFGLGVVQRIVDDFGPKTRQPPV